MSEGSPAATLGGVLASLREMLPQEAGLAVLDDRCAAPALLPGEAEIVARAVASRRDEFARGRACARAALAELGVAARPILADAARAPIWPAGFAGSITHCAGLVAAAAMRRETALAVGLDAEPRAPLEADLVERIAVPDELAAAQALLAGAAEDAARLLFSAKECVHKCIHPLTGHTLDFLDVRVELDAEAAFRVSPKGARGGSIEVIGALEGRFRITDGHVLTSALVAGAD